MVAEEKIEILPVSLLGQHRSKVIALKRLARKLGIEFGWHYLLDLTWVLNHLEIGEGNYIMDAGAGTGIVQWYLAEQGVEVLSVDRESRAYLPLRFRLRYRVKGKREQDLSTIAGSIEYNANRGNGFLGKLDVVVKEVARAGIPLPRKGQVVIYNQDLIRLVDVPDKSLDAVVAVSSLEHNSLQSMKGVVEELMRVLKPGGVLLATLGAASDEDWFHEPSQGWCYTDHSLRRIFGLPTGVFSNYGQYNDLFAALRACSELKDNLASFYAQSGDNGMPWGVWDPQYQPVGVCKVK